MKNKSARRKKRKTEKLKRKRARARIPRLEFAIDVGNPTAEFRAALFDATRKALSTREGIDLMERRDRYVDPEWRLTMLAYGQLPDKFFQRGYPVEQGNVNSLGDDLATFVFRRLRRMRQGWYSPHRPTVEFGGNSRIIVWSHHACQRLVERTTRGSEVAEDWDDAFTAMYCIRQFERYHSGIKIWMPCDPGTVQYSLASFITGEDELPEDAHILVGYADVELLGDRLALVKTLLPPGFTNTPEWRYVGQKFSELSLDGLQALTGKLLTMRGACFLGGCDILRELHENGYPQVKCMADEVDYFPGSVSKKLARQRRRASMVKDVFKVIMAQRGRKPR